MNIDINCDMGESYGRFKIGNDKEIMPLVSSCNIACGFHAGDPMHIEETIKLALKHDVAIGAHPSYPDLAGFGRRKMQINAEELTALVKYQIVALKGLTESLGGKVAYVKPHGALYNSAADHEEEAKAICMAIQAIDPNLMLMGLAGSTMESVAESAHIAFIREAFADRRYTPEGRLMSRKLDNAVINNANEAAHQVIGICTKNEVIASNSASIAIVADSICIHGDNPGAIDILKAIHKSARDHGISIQSFIAS